MALRCLAARLRDELASLVAELSELMDGTRIEYLKRSAGGVIILAPKYYWEPLSPEGRNRQMVLNRRYNRFVEILTVVFSRGSKDVNRQLDQADQSVRKWVEFGSNWSLKPNPTANREALAEDASALFEILAILDAHPEAGIVLIPDTNALLNAPDPTAYRQLAGDRLTFLLLPTVISELDELKVTHRVPEVREKAQKVIQRIKGWRQQGSLLTGATVDGTITVKLSAEEPKVSQSLPWLDEHVKDDRIVAAALEVQADYPAATVLLVTGDLNLQTKAEAAMITYAEPPSGDA